MRPRTPVILLLLLLGLFGARGARAAGTQDLFGAPGSLAPLSALALDSHGAVVANPAALALLGEGVWLGLSLAGGDLDLSYLGRPQGSDISAQVFDAWPSPAGKPMPTAMLAPRGGSNPDFSVWMLDAGFVRRLGPLVLGFSTVLPLGALQNQQPFFNDQRQQYFDNSLHFELLGDRLETSQMAVALAASPLPWLHLGAGLTLQSASTASTGVFVQDALDRDGALYLPRVRVKNSFAAQASAAFVPGGAGGDLAIFLRWQGPAASTVEARSSQLIYGLEPDDQGGSAQDFVYGWLPHRLGLGASRSFHPSPGLALEAQLDASWWQWSAYRNRSGDRPLDTWQNTMPLSGALLLRPRGLPNLGLSALFAPSPVPPQVGRENHLDSNRLGLALALGLPFRLAGTAFELRLAGQAHWYQDRSVRKDLGAAHPVSDEFPDSDSADGASLADSAGLQTNNPGYPGYALGGVLWHLGLSLVMGPSQPSTKGPPAP